jgi:hypothetical protein
MLNYGLYIIKMSKILLYAYLSGFGIITDNLHADGLNTLKEQNCHIYYAPGYTKGTRAFAGPIKCRNGGSSYTFTIASPSGE